jgi:membrane associated rhomboid family serine protease
MTSTPVGMRCPECANQRTRVHQGTGGSLAQTTAPATFALIAINVIAFVAELLGGGSSSFDGGGKLIREAALNGPAVDGGDYWRLITGGFLHAGLLHLGFNMFALYILGTLLEPAIGTARFLGIYFVSLLAGSCGALLLDPNENTVGASGAIFGLMSAAFIIARGRRLESLASQIGIFVILNLVFTFSIPNISIGAHLGGLVGGALAALVISAVERRHFPRSRVLEAGALVVLLIVAVGVAIWAAGRPEVAG